MPQSHLLQTIGLVRLVHAAVASPDKQRIEQVKLFYTIQLMCNRFGFKIKNKTNTTNASGSGNNLVKVEIILILPKTRLVQQIYKAHTVL